MICSLSVRSPCSGSPSKQGGRILLRLIHSVFSSPAGLSMCCRTHERWHFLTCCNREIMHFLFKDPFASQFRFFSQVFTSAPGIASIWGEGRESVMGEQGWTCSRWHLSSFLCCFSLQGLFCLVWLAAKC